MWGTSSPDDKRVSDLAKAAEATKIGARRLDRLMAGKLSPRNFGLLQQYLPIPIPDLSRCSKTALYSITSSASNCTELGTSRPSALAVCALITNSNLVDCRTGRSAGVAPLRIRP